MVGGPTGLLVWCKKLLGRCKHLRTGPYDRRGNLRHPSPRRPRGGPVPPADPHHPVRPDAGHVPGRARPDHRRAPRSAPSPTTCTASAAGLGHHRVPDHRRRSARRSTASCPTSTAASRSSSPRSASSSSARSLCALRRLDVQLAAFRAVQGLGAGGLFSLALTIIGDIVPPRERARYQGYFLAVFGTSSVLGPVIGGFLAGPDQHPRHHRLALGLPASTCRSASLALVVVAQVLNMPHTRRDHRIDWPGALTLVVGLVPLLIVAEQGRDWGWDSTRSRRLLRHRRWSGSSLFLLAERWYRRRRAAAAAAVPRPHVQHRLAASASSSAWACSAGCCCCRSTCRS